MAEANSNKNQLAIHRITALWALNESGLGGIMHAFNSPFTGLVVGSIVVILISIICDLSENKFKTVLGALTIVLIIKAAVAPHSNLTAYLAVSFQAVAGAFLYSTIKSVSVASLLFAIIALVESGLQKIIVLFVLYGNTFWEALNEFGEWASNKLGFLMPYTTSKTVVGIYVAMHILVGIMVGLFVIRLLKDLRSKRDDPRFNLLINSGQEVGSAMTRKRGQKIMAMIVFLILLLSLMVYGYLTGGWQKGLYVFGRAIILLSVLYLIVAPLLLKYIKKYLTKRRADLSDEVDRVFDIIPALRLIVKRAYDESKSLPLFKRMYMFLLHTILYAINFTQET